MEVSEDEILRGIEGEEELDFVDRGSEYEEQQQSNVETEIVHNNDLDIRYELHQSR